ncbi:hypothetical protein QUC31_012506 [Theobroma cacao]
MALVRVPSSFPSILPSVFPKKLLSVSSSFPISCSSKSTPNQVKNNDDNSNIDNPKEPKRLSEQSSWEAKDSEGRDYLYRLGKEADNMNIAVGARAGVIDDLFAGNFLGRDSDVVFDYRQKVTKSFEYLQGDYYIAPAFMDDKLTRMCVALEGLVSVISQMELAQIKLVSSMKLHKDEKTAMNDTGAVRNLAEMSELCRPLIFLFLEYPHICHIVKNYLAYLLNVKIPLILGIWGGKGQGKSFQTELIFQAMGIEPVIMSAGELESERAGEPGKLIRERYRTASQVVQNQVRSFTTLIFDICMSGFMKFNNALLYLWFNACDISLLIALFNVSKNISFLHFFLKYIVILLHDNMGSSFKFHSLMGKMSCLMINDIDAGLGRFGNTQMTVNNQIVVGTLMNLSDNPTRVSIGQDWRESDITNRIPIIATGNDFSTLYAPLIRDGRMEKFYWQPTHEDIVNIVHRMYEKDGISKDDVVNIVDKFPNQALDFYGALRSRTYDRSIAKWIEDIGGVEKLGHKLLRRRKNEELPVYTPPKQTVEALLESGYSLLREQQLITETKLSKEYMKNMDD